MRDLLMADPGAVVSTFMQTDLITGHINDAAEDIARKIAHYNLVALPVVDDDGKLVGMVTVDDAMDLILPPDWQARMPRVFH